MNSLWRYRGEIPGQLFAVLLLVALITTGCQKSTRWENTSTNSPSQAGSSRGNPPSYEVFGRRYYVIDSSAGFRERGVASWYGKKFHGNPTSSGEIYNMHRMTAAHKSLPLPTRVRVTNLKNGRSLVVRVNDRGPFIGNRIIDLSYAAAQRLDMIRDGTALVEIVALDTTTRTSAKAPAKPRFEPVAAQGAEQTVNVYLQVGAFGDRLNANELLQRLRGNGFANAFIRSDANRQKLIYRVRLGPIASATEYDALIDRMAALSITDTHLVTETQATAGT